MGKNFPYNFFVDPTSCFPESSFIKEIPEGNKRYHLRRISSVARERLPKADRCYIRPLVVIPSTTLSEFPIPKGLVLVHFKAKKAQ